MPGQEQQRPQRREDEPDDAPAPPPGAAAAKQTSNDDIDSVLDEIDEVLESNAEDFVRAFVQKGGQ
jgi:ubiquitin-like protein Pup